MGRPDECVIKPDLKIRPIQAGDADRLIKLTNAGTDAVPALAEHLPDAIRRKIEGNDQNTFRLVALMWDEIIGQAALSFGFPPQPSIGRLTIIVREDQRGQGAGTALLAELLAQAGYRLGLPRIELAVRSDNQGAIRLYRNFGFEEEGQSVGTDGSPILLMARGMNPKR